MRIARFYDHLDRYLTPNKVLIIYGPRRVGKTSLVKNYLQSTKYNFRFDTGDDIVVQNTLSSQNLNKIKEFVGEKKLVVIDEAQNISEVGVALKLMVDNINDICIIATGSTSFDLASKIGEPLVGRSRIIELFPISQLELSQKNTPYDLKRNLEQYLLFGSYPEVITASTNKEKARILTQTVRSYLLKDILAIERVKSPHLLHKLLKLLAFQLSNEVSLNELASQLEIDRKTVERYLYLLEQSFILFSLPPYSTNLRKAISKKYKYYFVDLGIRNAIINNFNNLETRNDVGQLWENFIISERIKKQNYQEIYSNNYFWRTYDQKEIDYIEMRDGKLNGYEFKWNKTNSKNKQAWLNSYPDEALFEVINKNNYLKFVS
ncbi:MAG: hypothetical protein XD95_0119 [Microgenomates bacterium 39_7]|nr:MAG: hypothetical protein XD95_0119 [Microgenomates bacterium 39_7]